MQKNSDSSNDPLKIIGEKKISDGVYTFFVASDACGASGDFVGFDHAPSEAKVSQAPAIGTWKVGEDTHLGEGRANAGPGTYVVARRLSPLPSATSKPWVIIKVTT